MIGNLIPDADTATTCPYCHVAQAPDRTVCVACRRSLIPLTCWRCGFANPAGLRFCGDCGARLADQPGSAPAAAGERRQLTVLFCDLVDSSGLSRRLDPEDYRALLGRYREACGSVSVALGGTQIRYVGDGIRVYFGFPQAHEDDAERAVRAGLAMVEAVGRLAGSPELQGRVPLAVRVGIASGLVVAGWLWADGSGHESEAVGEPPNLAARLQSLAPSNGVVVGVSTKRLLGRVFEFDDLGAHRLKGFDAPVRAWRVREPCTAESRFDVTRDPDAPLIGRERELASLREHWEQTLCGAGRIVLVSGEAGIGKSRLVRGFQEWLGKRANHRLLYYQCSPYHVSSPLHPVIRQLERAAGIRSRDSATLRYDKLTALLASDNEHLEMLPVFARLLSIPSEGLYRPPEAVGQRLRELTFEHLLGQFHRLADDRPLLLIYEDIHWIDPTSLEVLQRAMPGVAGRPILMLLTTRGTKQPIAWPDLEHFFHIGLQGLSVEQCLNLVEHLPGMSSVSRDRMARLLERSDGIPLYVEELARTLVEGPLSQSDAEPTDLPEQLNIPTTLRDLLMARLDQVGDAKNVLQVGAVLGRSFSTRLLGAVTSRPMAELQEALLRLEQAALVLRSGSGDETRYEFRHALLREAANDSLLHSSRQALHRRVAQVLESDYPQLSVKQPEQLARHFSEAGMAEKAVEYWLQAGRRASEQSANPEAVSHLRQGLRELPHLSDLDQRQRRELELLAVLGPALIVTRGPATAEVARVYSRALELCAELPESPLHFAVLWGWSRISANYGIKRERAERMLALARQLGDPGLELQAHHSLWASLFHLGQLQLCHQHIQQGLSLYAGGDYRWHAAIYGGHDPRVCAEGEAAQALWLMGHPDRAVERSHAALAWAEELAHSGSIVHAMDMALLIHHYRRDRLAVKVQARQMSDYAELHGFPEYRAKSLIFLAWAEASREDPELGLKSLREAVDAHRNLGTREDFQVFSTMLAEMYAAVNQPDAGLVQIDQALDEGRASGLCFWEAELHRWRGELLLQLSGSGAEEGSACFQRALGVARTQQARSLELRAVMSLAAWWRQQGQGRKARLLLEPVYRRFGGGLDSADLQDARRLLESLG